VPQIEVTFDIDANGILNVKARDKGTSREQSVTVTAASTLSKDEVDRLVKEAESHAAEDRAKREEVELHNQADQMVDEAERVLRENAERIPADVRTDLEAKKEALTNAKSSDVNTLRRAMDEFNEALQKVGQAVYQEAGATAGSRQQPGPSGQQGEDEVVDADYREVK
jgi:molecular chaperone DnaK